MTSESFKMTSNDGVPLHVYSWPVKEKGKIKGVVQIVHGMAEHGKRYEHFAHILVNSGYAVYAGDLRGHGKTAGSIKNLGYIADKNGWDLVVGDIYLLTQTIRSKHPDLPVFVFGHSMGSFLTRDYISKCHQGIKGVILSGTSGNMGSLPNFGIALATLLSFVKNKKTKSPLLDKLVLGNLNKAFKPAVTPLDWLSRDKEAVEKYINDPYCGTVFKLGFFRDLFHGIKQINKPESFEKTDKHLPIHFISGARDIVGRNTKGVMETVHRYQNAGMREVTYKFYEGARHEMLNEINREEVIGDIIGWLDNHI